MNKCMRPYLFVFLWTLPILAVSPSPRLAPAAEAGASDADVKSAFGQAFGGYYQIEAQPPYVTNSRTDPEGNVALVEIEGNPVIIDTTDFNIRCAKFSLTPEDGLVNAEAPGSGNVKIKSEAQGFDATCDRMNYNTKTGSIDLIGHAEFIKLSEGNNIRMVGDRISIDQKGEGEMTVNIRKSSQTGGRRARVLTGPKAMAAGVSNAVAPVAAIAEGSPAAQTAVARQDAEATGPASPAWTPPEQVLIKKNN